MRDVPARAGEFLLAQSGLPPHPFEQIAGHGGRVSAWIRQIRVRFAPVSAGGALVSPGAPRLALAGAVVVDAALDGSRMDRAPTLAAAPLAREGRERPVVAIGVSHREVAQLIVGLVGQLVHDRCLQRSARVITASGWAVTTCNELVPDRHGVGRSPLPESMIRPPSGQSNWQWWIAPSCSLGIMRSSVNPTASSQPRSASASSLTTLAQMLCCRVPLARTAMVVSVTG